MINKFINNINAIDKSILRVIITGLKVSLVICVLSAFILCLYMQNHSSYIAFQARN